jgi:hypothetical protein
MQWGQRHAPDGCASMQPGVIDAAQGRASTDSPNAVFVAAISFVIATTLHSFGDPDAGRRS